MKQLLLLSLTASVLFLPLSCRQDPVTIEKDGFTLVLQKGNAPALGYCPDSGIGLIRKGGKVFKDLSRDGELDVYEDWRKDARSRARDLASKLSKEEIAGLMLYSWHQRIEDSIPTPEQLRFMKEDHIRHILVTKLQSTRIAVAWTNRIQALAEELPWGIPANNSSDPRHSGSHFDEFTAGAGGNISRWPQAIGLAATFDPELARQFGDIARQELRALGITTYLGPQIDLATEPRWKRFAGTWGESPELNRDFTQAFIGALQTTPGARKGWGPGSLNAMAKHWPGVGSCEGGREAHLHIGKYAVYPGNGFELQIKPFTEAAFHCEGATGCCSAIMPGYPVPWGIDPSGKNVGPNFSPYFIGQLLRGKYGFEGVVCTDWAVTRDRIDAEYWWEPREQDPALFHGGKCWGVENLSVAERHLAIVEAGCDQFGGNNVVGPVLEAWQLWEEKYGEKSARERFEQSAVRILVNIFRTGLFENPYLDTAESEKIVGNPAFMEAGYLAQLRSVIMLKNHGNVLPRRERKKVYLPEYHQHAAKKFFEGYNKESCELPIKRELLEKYYDFTDNPEEADFALVVLKGPESLWGFDSADKQAGGNGFVPIPLQWEDYTAEEAREKSIAGQDRSYRGKTIRSYNRDDLVILRRTREAMGTKPVIALVTSPRPFVPAEIEPLADAILLSLGGVSDQAILDLVSGSAEPSGLLPAQLPVDMATVEYQYEDLPFDMETYRDADGHRYDFGFGLDWNGLIQDERTKKYIKTNTF